MQTSRIDSRRSYDWPDVWDRSALLSQENVPHMDYIYKDWGRIGPSGGRAVGRTTTDGISKVCKNCERLTPTILVKHIDDLLVPNL